MEPISLIVAALSAGAAAGVTNTVTSVVNDAYAGLKALVRQRLTGRQAGEVALEHYETNPDAWGPILAAELADADAADCELLTAAQHLMALLDPDGVRTGRYQVDARRAQGVQIGDHGIQCNTFSGPPLT
jgi:hypothetical protein